MRLRKPDSDQMFVLALVVGGAFGVAFMGYTTFDGFRSWLAARHYPPGSICARQHLARMDVDAAMISAGTTRPGDTMEEREKQQGEQGARIAEAERTPAEAFFTIVEAAEKAKRAGAAAPNTLCLPEHLSDQQDAIYAAYAADLSGRLKAHPELCNVDADVDAMKWIVQRFPCASSAHP